MLQLFCKTLSSIARTSISDLRHINRKKSDRGVQYCCNAYTNLLNQYGIKISMTEDYKPTDNAIAERVNGTLKTEVVYREKRFKNFEDAKERISQFIDFYNNLRPHGSIGYKVPSEVHVETGMQKRMWNNP